MDYYIKGLETEWKEESARVRYGRKDIGVHGSRNADVAGRCRFLSLLYGLSAKYIPLKDRRTYRTYQGWFRSDINAAVRASVLKQNPRCKIDASDKIAMPESNGNILLSKR